MLVKNKKSGVIFEVGTNLTEHTTITTRAYELSKNKYSLISKDTGASISSPVKKKQDVEPVVKVKPKNVIDL